MSGRRYLLQLMDKVFSKLEHEGRRLLTKMQWSIKSRVLVLSRRLRMPLCFKARNITCIIETCQSPIFNSKDEYPGPGRQMRKTSASSTRLLVWSLGCPEIDGAMRFTPPVCLLPTFPAASQDQNLSAHPKKNESLRLMAMIPM